MTKRRMFQMKKNRILALTGATITSKAVTAAVNEALSYYDSNLKGAE